MTQQNSKTLREVITENRARAHQGIIIMPDGREMTSVELSFNEKAGQELDSHHRAFLMKLQDFAVRQDLCAEVDFTRATANRNGIRIHCTDVFQAAIERARMSGVSKILDYKCL